MPAQVVPRMPALPASRYAVVGTYAQADSRFVKHVALAREDGQLVYGTGVRVWHMGPPLVADEQSLAKTGKDPECAAHIVGWLDLTADERDGITDWLAEVGKEDRPTDFRRIFDQYTASSHSDHEWMLDEQGVRQYRRFSCVSFVLTAYWEGAGVSLLEMATPDRLPEIGVETLTQAYGPRVREPERRARIDLPGAGPWRVALAGYVIHALNRPDIQIRQLAHHVTSAAEAEFPLPSS